MTGKRHPAITALYERYGSNVTFRPLGRGIYEAFTVDAGQYRPPYRTTVVAFGSLDEIERQVNPAPLPDPPAPHQDGEKK